jgi:hypothetical protein
MYEGGGSVTTAWQMSDLHTETAEGKNPEKAGKSVPIT